LDVSNEEFTIGECPVSGLTCGVDMGSQTSCSSWDLAIVILHSMSMEVDVPYGGWYCAAGAAVGMS